MPQAIDLVVKNGAATPVDKTFALVSPSAGYGSVAEWALREGTVSGAFPSFTASATNSSQRGSRQLKVRFRLPATYVDPQTGLTALASNFEFNGSVSVPHEFPEALKADAVAFTVNLLNTALVKQLIKDAVPAT